MTHNYAADVRRPRTCVEIPWGTYEGDYPGPRLMLSLQEAIGMRDALVAAVERLRADQRAWASQLAAESDEAQDATK